MEPAGTPAPMPRPRTARWRLVVLSTILVLLAAYLVADILTARMLKEAIAEVEQERGRLTASAAQTPIAELNHQNNRTRVVEAAGALIVMESIEDAELRRFLRGESISAPAGGPDIEQTEAVAAVLRRNALALDLLSHLSERTDSRWPGHMQSAEHTPPLSPMVRLNLLSLASALLAADEGGHAEAMTHVTTSALLISTLRMEASSLLTQLVRTSMVEAWLNVARRLLATTRVEDGDAAKLAAFISEERKLPPIPTGLEGELWYQHRLYSRLESGQEDVRGMPVWLRFLPRLARPLLRADHARQVRRISELIQLAQTPPYRRDPVPRDGSFAWWEFLGKLSYPGLVRSLSEGDRHEARLEVALAGLALARYRLDHGAYPPALNDLVPDFLDAVPIDPSTGQPLDYQRAGEGYTLRASAAMKDASPRSDRGPSLLVWTMTR